MVKVVRGMVIDDDGKPMLGIPQKGEVGYDPDAYKTALTTFGTSVAPYMLGVPYAANEVYEGLTNNDLMRSGFGAVGGILGTAGGGPQISTRYAKTQMPKQDVFMNTEATSPTLLQNVENSSAGLALSDARFNKALQAADDKTLKMSRGPVTKTQGVWVDPTEGTEEFNRVYSQNLGKLDKTPIQENRVLEAYANSMGGDLKQIGVGAGRFSKLPANVGKRDADAIKYDNVSKQDIIDAGTKLNPKGGIVSATPDGGMVAFPDPYFATPLTAKQIDGLLKMKKPQYGLLDSAFFDTSKIRQGQYMKSIDDLITRFGFGL